MIAIPTVDVRAGNCVRQPEPTGVGGDYLLNDAFGATRGLALAGFRQVQIVDRDAEADAGSNAGLIDRIIRDSAIEVQVSGRVESTEQIELLIDSGAARIVVGARGFDEPEWLADAANLFPGVLMVATDVRERRVVTRGWVHGLPVDIRDLVDDLAGVPLGGLVVASVPLGKQHTNSDLALLEDLVEAATFPVLAAGGVSTIDDLHALEHRGIVGAVLGTVLFSGILDPRRVAAEFAGGL